MRTLSTHVETNLLFRRIPARMFSVLGPMLLMLAAIGIYAVVSYTVSQRTTEIGVRLALGATPGGVVGHFVRESLLVIGVGALAGWAVALSGLIILGAALDVAILAGVPALLMAVAASACWLSARRAALRPDGGAEAAVEGCVARRRSNGEDSPRRTKRTKTNEEATAG